MSDSRRYSEEAIAEIFRQAAEAQADARNRAGAPDGLTLEEIQEIGAEAGLSPEFVRKAAERLHTQVRTDPAPSLFGLDIGVARSVDLPGRVTEAQWHDLVGDLRHTFRAKGKVHEHGAFKEWSNGNLHVMLEPNGDKHRLRMRTMKQTSRDLMFGGVTVGTMGLLFMLFILTVRGAADPDALVTAPLFIGGIIMAAIGYLQLPRWSETRSLQMEDIARRAVERMQDHAEQAANREALPAAEADAEPLLEMEDAETEPAMEPRRLGRERS
ncbi:MAG: hypothetical protein JJ896_10370 [Rhodothermales bacterium]|nr:hypothetical protein [Rhodothermales bacterium]MBO6780045.1 hypothetical protein [Rhodothermales bacterium]